MSFFCLMQEMYKYIVKGETPGTAYVERLPFNLHRHFNSSTVAGRANVTKATMALAATASVAAYIVGPTIVKAISPHEQSKKE